MRALRQRAWFALMALCLIGCAIPRVARAQGQEKAEKKTPEPPHELLYHTINFAILVAGLVYVLRKPLGEFFSSRSASIHKRLEEGRKAIESSQAQLKAVEEKLRGLEAEIAAFKDSAAREMEAERQRWQQTIAEEAARIVESARVQTQMAVRGARLELKGYTARNAVARAEELIRARLDEPGRKRLVTQFVATLGNEGQRN
jgi:F-type H+-transporting ATPase subunit b